MTRAEQLRQIADDIRRDFPEHALYLDTLAKPHGNSKPRDEFGCNEDHYNQAKLYRDLKRMIARKVAANPALSEAECAEMVLRAEARALDVDLSWLRNLLAKRGSSYQRLREILQREGEV